MNPCDGICQVNGEDAQPHAAHAASATHTEQLIQLIGRHRTKLVGHVKRILGSAEDAEDVVQETCVRLMRVRDFWRGDRQVRAFLFKIATNLARDELRRRRACAYGEHLPYDTLDLVGDGLQPDEIVDRFATLEAISNALQRLPPRHREVFNLHVEAQLSYRAISKRLGISTKTVERDLCGAREYCQDRLGPAARPAAWPLLAGSFDSRLVS
jgi:RNA polymerase sigma factor (sigma-70 family)